MISMDISLVCYLQDGTETVPTRLQDRTDAECYNDFKDEYEGEVLLNASSNKTSMLNEREINLGVFVKVASFLRFQFGA